MLFDGDGWDALNPFDQFNMALPGTPKTGGPATDIRPSLARAAGPGVRDVGNDAGRLSLENPLVWAGGAVALLLGLIGGATQFRVGKAKVTATAGTP